MEAAPLILKIKCSKYITGRMNEKPNNKSDPSWDLWKDQDWIISSQFVRNAQPSSSY